MTKITRDDVLKLAQLSKLSLTESECDKFVDEIQSILQYVEQLQSLDLDDLPPTNQVTGLINSTRKDEPHDYGVDPQTLLDLAPQVEQNQIKTKRMIG